METSVSDFQDLIRDYPSWNGGHNIREVGSFLIIPIPFFSTNGERIPMNNATGLKQFLMESFTNKDDGLFPSDNSLFCKPAPEMLSCLNSATYGNRNPQGRIYDQKKDRIWSVEHGPTGGEGRIKSDRKSKNYGWPVITYGII